MIFPRQPLTLPEFSARKSAGPPGTAASRFFVACLALLAGAGLFAAGAPASVAGASTVGRLRSRAAQLASEIDTANAHLSVLSEEYDQAKLRLGQLDAQLATDQKRYARTRTSVRKDVVALRDEVLAAYVEGGGATTGSLGSVLASNDPSAAAAAGTYLQASTSNLETSMTALHDAEHRLDVNHLVLESAHTKASAAEATLSADQRTANTLIAQLSADRSQVNGQLATAVAAAEQASAARQAAAAATRSAAQSAAAQPQPASASTVAAVPVQSGGAGLAAVRAAESQLGAPYVWAGASPGVGFDCSGLTMWSWAQAGVNLPHSAQAQYDATTHVSLSALQPGDLVFYASGGYIYHVIMYVGSGPYGTDTAIQALNTGTVIQYTSVWPGAYGASQP